MEAACEEELSAKGVNYWTSNPVVGGSTPPGRAR